MHRSIILLLSCLTIALAAGPTLRTIDTFTGTLTNSSSIQFKEIKKTAYGSSNVSVTINFEKGNNDISNLNVLYCLQRKLNNPGLAFSGCTNKIVLTNISFDGPAPVTPPVSEEPVEEPIEEPVEEPIEEPVEEPIEEPIEEPVEEPIEEFSGGSIFNNGAFPVTSPVSFLEGEQTYYSYIKFGDSNATDLKFTVKIEVYSCGIGEYINNKGDCEQATEANNGDSITGNVAKDTSIGIIFKVPKIENNILGGKILNITTTPDKTTSIKTLFKFGAAPTPTDYDFYFNATSKGHVTIPINMTATGSWYSSIVFGEDTAYTIDHKSSYCPAMDNVTSYGYDCNVPISNFTVDGKLVIGRAYADRLVYYRIDSGFNGTGSLNISLGSYNQSTNNYFELYVSENEAPFYSNNSQLSISDHLHCSLDKTACTRVYTIKLDDVKASSKYYVGVRFVGGTGNSTYFGLFKNSLCSECLNGGTCSSTGETRGACTCKDEYEGLNCGVPRQAWKIQLIVLIVIGGLLFLTTLIGLIAWIISRKKKKEGYEKV